ncbi:histidine phosphatase family protein [Bifidobacterium sp. ESL0798]|uniref:histidine phosphatase family protein n=1 Tax=Bifidobacterium sp. ESL0798 TaxID=2983235 RepID=UPI0023F90D02|nr:histidine phosphatase family protein [Bifidobacterium sp. ESL0798]WEV73834.1 histidine phosphatase family protein [Bifidobacterium sp. ESL0798]
MKPTIIYLARHTETTSNTMGLMQGWSDFPVTRHGRDIIKCFGLGLKGIVFDAAYSGSLPRHYKTAQGALDYSGNGTVELIRDPDLREDNFGSFEGRSGKETNLAGANYLGYPTLEAGLADRGTIINLDIQDAWHDLDAKNVLNTDLDASVRAETSDDVRKRMKRAMTKIGEAEAKHGGGNVLVVSSGLSIRQFLFLIDQTLDFTGPKNTATTKLRYENGTFSILGQPYSMEYYERGKASLSD